MQLRLEQAYFLPPSSPPCSGDLSLLLFHLFADFFLALGADFRPLCALGFHHLFAAQQFDEAFSPPSPLRKPVRMMRRYPPVRSPNRGATVSNSRSTDSRGHHVASARRRAATSPRLPRVIIFSTCGRIALAFVDRGLNALFHNDARSPGCAAMRADGWCFVRFSYLIHDDA